MPTTTQNALAQRLKSLHVPGKPLILTNVWDALSARSIIILPTTHALATASAAIATAAALSDDDLTLPINLAAIRAVAKIANQHHKPLTVDFQDGFGEQLEDGLREVIRAGAVGINLEDFGRELGAGKGDLYDVQTAQERIRRVLRVAEQEGVPDFVVNARTDALLVGRPLSEAIERGKAYLQAGAHNIFIWGGSKRGGFARTEVEEACKALDGKLNVSLKWVAPGLTIKELSEIGVARISVGPQLMMKAEGAIKEEAARIQSGEKA
jgi:2-methylisocitrate lyase-like PEP mutase family enzyme